MSTARMMPLGALADEVAAQHQHVQRCARDAVDHSVTAGRLLAEAKTQLSPDEWETLLRDHVRITERTAHTLIRMASEATEERRLADGVRHLWHALHGTPGTEPPP